jgi:hypothetical protein
MPVELAERFSFGRAREIKKANDMSRNTKD